MQTSAEGRLNSVQEILKNTEYPAEKRNLVERARQHDVSKDVPDDIENLLKVYASAADK